jgi:LMBR1 domain-containing protein 1
VDALEDCYKAVEVSYRVRGGNPIWPWISLIIGILTILFSAFWILHVIIFYYAQVHPFLNAFFVAMDNAFPYAAVVFYGLFVYYLFWTVLDGTTAVGVNFLFIRLHPMERGNTPVTSIMFNTAILLFASFGVALFSSLNFSLYSRLTSIDMIYTVQMQYLAGLRHVWKWGIVAWFVFIGLGLFYKACTIRKPDRKLDILRECFERHDLHGINPGSKKKNKQNSVETAPANNQDGLVF